MSGVGQRGQGRSTGVREYGSTGVRECNPPLSYPSPPLGRVGIVIQYVLYLVICLHGPSKRDESKECRFYPSCSDSEGKPYQQTTIPRGVGYEVGRGRGWVDDDRW